MQTFDKAPLRGARAPAARHRLPALLTATASLIATAAALAAGTADAAPAADAQAGASGPAEVVVTGRHRTEAAQSVPATVSVVSGAFIAKTNTTSITQLISYLPSIQFSFFNPRNSSLNIRGLGDASGVASDGMDPGVGFYVDQIYYNRPAMATFDLVDINQVEVLEGPQGTLFGKNTTAGVISITTAAPSFTPQAKGEVTVGNYGDYVVKGSVTGGLIGDVLAGRLSVATSQLGGYNINDFNGDKTAGYRDITVRGQLLYQPTNDFRVRLIADYDRQNASCCASGLSAIVSPLNGKNYLTLAQSFGYTPVVDPFNRHVDVNSPVYARQETGGVSAQADWSLPGATLSSITSWRLWNWWPGNDVDSSPLSVITVGNGIDHENQTTQEFRIASAGRNLVDYVGGLYFFREQVEQNAVVTYGNAGSAFIFGSPNAAILNGYGSVTNASVDSWSYAAYGQGTWHVASNWDLTGGLRYTYDVKSGGFVQTVGGGAPSTGAAESAMRLAIASPGGFSTKLDQGEVSGQANLSYHPTDNVLTYLTLARGYRSGGINLTVLPAGASPTIAPESIDSVELGAKTRFFDRRLTLNGSLFYESDRNYQGTVTILGTTRQYLANVPKVESKGVELSAQAQPNANLSLYASGVYDEAKYVSFPNAPCGLENVLATSCSLTGRPLAGVPRWSLSAGGEVHAPLTVGPRTLEAYLGADGSFRSSNYSSTTDSIYTLLPNLNLLNLRLGFRAGDGRWDVFLWGNNVTNVKYFTNTAPGIGNTGAIYSALGAPETFGVTLKGRL